MTNQQPGALQKLQRGSDISLARFGSRIIRAMEPSATRGKTAQYVAERKRALDEAVPL